MVIIPAINETSFEEVGKKIIMASNFGAEIVHLDISDGKFTANPLWNNFFDLRDFIIANPHIKMQYEVHLMVSDPDSAIQDWIGVGATRLIVHVESSKDLAVMKKKCEHFGAQLLLAAGPETDVNQLLAHKDLVDGFLVLAVPPGKAGQAFGENQLEKIKLLRQGAPDAKIEVDGGVNLGNAPEIKSGGADLLTAASAIWVSSIPAEAFKKFQSI